MGIGQAPVDIRPLTPNDLPYLGIVLKTKTPPNMMNRYFDLPGIIINEIGSGKDGEWTYQGKLILKPDRRLIEANNKALALQQH